jgi:hypothetical protein
VQNDPLGTMDTQLLGLSDGDYDIRLTAATICGFIRSHTVIVTVDNTPPIAVISSPDNCDAVDGVVPIVGTVSDTHLNGWTLQYTGGPTNGWVTIASGSGTVSNSLLANWNTASLPNCCYTLRLSASDRALVNCDTANTTEFLVSVDLGGCPADLNGNGTIGLADLTLLLSQFGTVCP